ncbi:alpha/beta hydrolase [Natronorubrum sp. FCH18a]|uniref:alpha/beta hydrolase n=1 Tax=Natronorubrum sp. FCH18a TaxID=3447018 RepID=UPI003F51873F
MTDVLVPGGRDVRGTLEEPTGETEAIVVACPPHPRHGGSCTDSRLVAVAEALLESEIACLRFDYGPWDDGYGEREDVRNAIRWARNADRFDRTDGEGLPVGVFGYSFGASQALLAAADVGADAVSALAPTARLADDLDARASLGRLDRPVQILYGERDSTVDWEPVVERAAERGDEVVPLAGDHFFVGKNATIAETVDDFFERTLLE